jgi:hypothetical protein
MELTVLGATGATGQELVRQALARDQDVTAVARRPANIDVPESDQLTRVAADVLTPGARAAVESGADHVIWLAAFGTGDSAPSAGPLTRGLLNTFMRKEMADRVTADDTVRAGGGTVFHAGPMSDGPLSATRRTIGLREVPRRLFGADQPGDHRRRHARRGRTPPLPGKHRGPARTLRVVRPRTWCGHTSDTTMARCSAAVVR